MPLCLFFKSCFWRDTDNYLDKEIIYACRHVEGPEPEMIFVLIQDGVSLHPTLTFLFLYCLTLSFTT